MIRTLLLSFLVVMAVVNAEDALLLRDQLLKAEVGDYVVMAYSKTATLMAIEAKDGDRLTIQELSVPLAIASTPHFSWKGWMANGAFSQTNWVRYTLSISTGHMLDYYSFTQGTWCNVAQLEQFLPTLLNLRLAKVPAENRKKVGPPPISGPDWRRYWQPRLIYEGQWIEGVLFDAWKARWPRDGSDLSGKTIEVYLPEKGSGYPSHFPYWLQVTGAVGKAKIHVVDVGKGMLFPQL